MTFDQFRRNGWDLEIECWRCKHRKRWGPQELPVSKARGEWNGDVHDLITRRAKCTACGAGSPNIIPTWTMYISSSYGPG